jgi:hypothetical protein
MIAKITITATRPMNGASRVSQLRVVDVVSFVIEDGWPG